MLGERVRLMVLSRKTTDIKQISLNQRQFILFSSVTLIIIFALTAFTLSYATKLFHNYQIANLQEDRGHLQQDLLKIKEKVNVLNDRLAQIEKTGDDLRNVANLPAINNDIRQVGIGGPVNYQSFEYLSYADEINKTAVEVSLDLDKLERAINLEKGSMLEISEQLSEQLDRLDHLPSIKPILGGYVTDGFGYRFHPVLRRRQHHPGVDIPMPIGTRVLSSADGIVRKVETKHNLYGKYILIDHGYGYESKYCHLSKILVKRGQKMSRWDPIGEVGKTGRTTGYHLHYEVINVGERQDPENYFYN